MAIAFHLTNRAVVGCLVLLCLGACGPFLLAQTACPPQNTRTTGWQANSTVKFAVSGFTAQEVDKIKAAVMSWSGSATQGNVTFQFTTDTGSSTALLFIAGSATGAPGQTTYLNGSGTQTLSSAIVNIDKKNTTFFNSTQSGYLDAILKVALHETGHTMGLGEEPVDPSKPNGGQVPGNTAMNGMSGVNDSGGLLPTTPTQCDKNSVAGVYSPPSGGGEAECGGPDPNCCHWDLASCSCIAWTCDASDGSGGPSPIIIDVDGSGYQLTSRDAGVRFDLNSDGRAELTPWTAADSTNVFLVLDRNLNGTIDNGREMFGNFTQMDDGTNAPNGWVALALFDEPQHGGNGDGVIDSADAVFKLLRLWRNTSHNGVSQPGELFTLPSLGVESISLDYKTEKRRDRYGNLFRYKAFVSGHDPVTGKAYRRYAFDVFFPDSGFRAENLLTSPGLSGWLKSVGLGFNYQRSRNPPLCVAKR